MFGPPDSYNAPTLSTLVQGTHILGSLPVGSRIRVHNPANGLLIAAGYLMMSNQCRCVVFYTSEGDGNFLGEAETWSLDKVYYFQGKKKMIDHLTDGTLERLYHLNKMLTVQRECPVVWEGVDEEVRSVILEEDEERAETERGNRLLEYYISENEEAVV